MFDSEVLDGIQIGVHIGQIVLGMVIGWMILPNEYPWAVLKSTMYCMALAWTE